MRKIFIPLITFILSFPGYAKTRTQGSNSTINDYYNNLYLDCISNSVEKNRNQHYSHGSAHHYSAVTYAKTVRTNLIKEINKSKDELKKLNDKLSQEHMPSDGRRVECRISQVSYVDLLSIDELKIDKRCYMVNFICEYFGESSHSHTYYLYYFAEDGTTYYRTEPYVKYGKINELEWATRILELIK